MTIKNSERAEWAAHALDAYGIHKEGRADYDAPEDMAADLICDLLHLIRAHDVVPDPLAKLETARMNFEAEEAEEKPKPRKRFEVLTRIGNGWENVWKEETDGIAKPQTFQTRKAAEKELTEFLKDAQRCVEGYSRKDYRVDEVRA